MGLCPPKTTLWSSNQSAISQQDEGFLTVRGVVHPRKLGLLAPPVNGRLGDDVERTLYRGWDPISSPGGAGSTYEPWPIRRSWAWDFHTLRGGINPDAIRVRLRVVGIVDVWLDFDPDM